MGLASESIDEETRARSELAIFLVRRQHDIEKRWLDRVTRDVRLSGFDLTDLRDAMPDYLARMASSLRRAGGSEAGGTEAWREVAREHGMTRVRLGFDIEQLVHEFIVLRQVIFELARETGLVTKPGQAGRVADLVEAGMEEAVRAYVESRDYIARQKQAEHIAFVTHELRSPLNSALLAATQARRAGPSPPTVTRPLEILERSLQRMNHLIADVLAAEQLEAAQVAVQKESLTLQELFEPFVASTRLAAEIKGVEFEARFDRSVRVSLDRRLTASAIQNLLDNATKFTDQGRVELTAETVRGDLIVHVRDTCGGIPDRDLRTIFEPFRRGRSDKPGTGLGLAIARRAIEAQGGTLEFRSMRGRGCDFWFTLPILHRKAKASDHDVH